ncbi:MAG: hypothetical protein EOO40_09105 [Deltaproteobacteria bacterium]|nr:MAG: hypothetical protein EOO40_09105 [Deltaproteobacteria bacterium]
MIRFRDIEHGAAAHATDMHTVPQVKRDDCTLTRSPLHLNFEHHPLRCRLAAPHEPLAIRPLRGLKQGVRQVDWLAESLKSAVVCPSAGSGYGAGGLLGPVGAGAGALVGAGLVAMGHRGGCGPVRHARALSRAAAVCG